VSDQDQINRYSDSPLWHEQVAGDAEAAGLQVVMDRCLKIEHARFNGSLHLAGFNTGVIDSRRPR